MAETEPTFTHVALPQELLQAIIRVLASLPWAQVNEVLAGIQQQARGIPGPAVPPGGSQVQPPSDAVN